MLVVVYIYAITVVATTPCFLLSPVAPRGSEGILIVDVAAALGIVRPRYWSYRTCEVQSRPIRPKQWFS